MKLVGFIDGVEVVFDYFPPNQFKAYIPKRLNGIYNVELKCIDDGGNESGLAGMYIHVDVQKMIFKVLEKLYIEKVDTANFTVKEVSNKYCYRELMI